MERHKLGVQADGIAGMKDICSLLSIGVDPVSEFQEYTEVVGADLNGTPIEAGLPTATWRWEMMPQSDFQYLLDHVNNVYLRTRKNSGTSGYDFANYLAILVRPTAESREGLLVRNVELKFVAMEIQL